METNLTKKDGVVTMDKSFEFMCNMLRNGEYTVTIKRKTKPRSLNQNALMWKWFHCVGAIMREETGDEAWTAQTVHDYYCTQFLCETIVVNGEPKTIVRGTSSLNTLQMHNFMEAIKIHVASTLGVILPLPEDQYYNEFINKYEGRY